jgi:hypothetical protein
MRGVVFCLHAHTSISSQHQLLLGVNEMSFEGGGVELIDHDVFFLMSRDDR